MRLGAAARSGACLRSTFPESSSGVSDLLAPFRSGANRRNPRTPLSLPCGMVTLSPPADTARFELMPRLPRDEGGAVFAEPWQAQGFRARCQVFRTRPFHLEGM